MSTPASPLHDALAQCSEIERACLCTLAALSAPTNRTRWANYLKAADVREGAGEPPKKRGRKPAAGRVVGTSRLAEMCEKWTDLKLVRAVQDAGGAGEFFACDQSAAHALMADPALADTRRRLGAHVLAEVNARGRYYDVRYVDYVLLARMALYEGDKAAARAYWQEGVRHRYSYLSMAELWLLLMPLHSPPEAITLMDEELQAEFLTTALEVALDAAIGVRPDTLELAWRHGQGAKWGALRAPALALAASRDAASTEAWETDVEDARCETGLQAAALAAALRGEGDLARQRVLLAWEASRGPKGRKRPRLVGPLAPLSTLMLAVGTTEHQAVAKAQLAQVNKGRARDAGDYQAVEWLFDGLPSLPPPGKRVPRVQRPFEHLASLLSGAFVHPGPHEGGAQHAEALAAHFRRASLPALAEAAEELTERFTNPAPEEPRRLLRLGRLKRPWEIALEGLEATLSGLQAEAKPAAEGSASRQRLAFFVRLVPRMIDFDDEDEASLMDDYDDLTDVPEWLIDSKMAEAACREGKLAASVAIEVKRQTRSKSGWTAGRSVALSKLAEGDASLDFISDADRRVVGRIVMGRTWSGGRHYSFSPRAAAALVGHPCVFWSDDPKGQAIEVVSAQPSLVVEETAGSLVLQTRPAVGKGGVGALRDAEGRLVVYELTPVQASVQRTLAEFPPIPAEGHGRLGQVLDKLGRDFTLHSSAGAAGLGQTSTQVPAEVRPLVQLTRAEPGLRISLRAAPLGPDGPCFAPLQGPRSVAAQVDGQLLRCERDTAREWEALKPVLAAAPLLEGALASGSHALDALPECLELLHSLRELGENDVLVQWADGEPLEVMATADTGSLRLDLDERQDWLEASGELQFDEAHVLSLQAALSQRTGDGRFVQLDAHRFVALDRELRATLDALQTASSLHGPATKAKGKAADALRIAPVALGFVRPWLSELKHLRARGRVGERLAAMDRALSEPVQVPRTLDAELRDYQRAGFEFMARLGEIGAGGLLADDMGLGKTLMALATLLHRAEHGPALVVAPTSVRSNWYDEALRFAPTLRLHEATALDHPDAPALGAFDVVVASYTVLAQRIESFETVEWTTVVLDEAQAIKNSATQRARAARRLIANARYVLTGTPVENHLGDLYSLMTFLNPGLLGTSTRFQERFARPIQRDGDRRAAADLKALVGPFMLRRRKSEVLTELPKRTEITLHVEPEPAERDFVEALRRDAVARLSQTDAEAQSPIHILAEITRLRRAACHPTLADAGAGRDVGSAKLDRLLRLVVDLKDEGHRCLVFSQFVGFLELAKPRFEDAGLTYQYLDGGTPEAARAKAVRAFQSGEGDAFLISLKAGGSGLNLTAADYVIHVDPWWNPAVEAQASDRAHRIGQTRPVTIYRLVNAGSIEERVLALHARKRELAEELLRDSDTPAQLDAQALMSLLEEE